MRTNRRRRLYAVAAIIVGVGVATALGLRALDQNLLYFYSPTQLAEAAEPGNRMFRVGGLVEEGSIVRAVGSDTVDFIVTDHANTIPVRYTGVLPDLFREGQGVVARGRLDPQGVFVAEEVLAKHDENYMPPEVMEALEHGKSRMQTSLSE
jgi:cytochrome c-type biogenesis protein CcmE